MLLAYVRLVLRLRLLRQEQTMFETQRVLDIVKREKEVLLAKVEESGQKVAAAEREVLQVREESTRIQERILGYC